MRKPNKIPSRYGSGLIGIEKHNSGYWGNHGSTSGDNGLFGYAIIIGIMMVSFFTLTMIV